MANCADIKITRDVGNLSQRGKRVEYETLHNRSTSKLMLLRTKRWWFGYGARGHKRAEKHPDLWSSPWTRLWTRPWSSGPWESSAGRRRPGSCRCLVFPPWAARGRIAGLRTENKKSPWGHLREAFRFLSDELGHALPTCHLSSSLNVEPVPLPTRLCKCYVLVSVPQVIWVNCLLTTYLFS